MAYYTGNEKVKLIDSLGICGCGTPEPVYEMVRCVLEEIFEEGVNIDRASEGPQYLYVIYMLNHQGFLEHGSSVFGSFPTEKGKKLRKALYEFSLCDYDYEYFFDENSIYTED